MQMICTLKTFSQINNRKPSFKKINSKYSAHDSCLFQGDNKTEVTVQPNVYTFRA